MMPQRTPGVAPPWRSALQAGSGRMSKSETREHHGREAARLRSLAAAVTTAVIRARLLDEAEKHRRLAQPDDRLVAETVQ